MKKIILLALTGIYFSSIICAAQTAKFGLVAGMNSSKYSTSLFSPRVGFHLGVKTEIVLSKELYCEVDALLSLKGGKVDWGEFGSVALNPYYLEVPVRIGYKYPINDNLKIFGKFGPYLAFGLFGKEIDSYGPGDTEEYDIFSGQDALKRFDAGVGLNLGIEINNRFQFTIGNDWGLVPVYEETSAEVDLGSGGRNLNLTLSLGFLF